MCNDLWVGKYSVRGLLNFQTRGAQIGLVNSFITNMGSRSHAPSDIDQICLSDMNKIT